MLNKVELGRIESNKVKLGAIGLNYCLVATSD